MHDNASKAALQLAHRSRASHSFHVSNNVSHGQVSAEGILKQDGLMAQEQQLIPVFASSHEPSNGTSALLMTHSDLATHQRLQHDRGCMPSRMKVPKRQPNSAL